MELMDVSGIWNLNEKKVDKLLYLWSLFGVLEAMLEVKDGLHRTGKKSGKNCMHWNVAPGALPGSATIGPLV